MSTQLVALRCPNCKTALSAQSEQRLFLCAKCPTAVEATKEGLVSYPALFAEGKGDYHLWWRFEAEVAITKFSATQPAATPYGTVDGEKTLLAVFLIPADETSIHACYRSALDAKQAPAAPRSDATVQGGELSRSAAEQIARQVFLTHVAQADGEVHCLDFTLRVKSTEVLVQSK